MIRIHTTILCDSCQHTIQVEGSGPIAINEFRSLGWVMQNGSDHCPNCQQQASTGPSYPDDPSIIWHSKAITEDDWNQSRAALIAEGWQMRYPPASGVVYLRKPYTPASE